MAFKGVFLEGTEVVLIVISLGAAQHRLGLAALAAAAAAVLVAVVGLLVARQLSEVPENTIKTLVGVMLTSFGVFWVGEGAGVHWPGDDLAIPVLVGFFVAVYFGFTAFMRTKLPPRRGHREGSPVTGARPGASGPSDASGGTSSSATRPSWPSPTGAIVALAFLLAGDRLAGAILLPLVAAVFLFLSTYRGRRRAPGGRPRQRPPRYRRPGAAIPFGFQATATDLLELRRSAQAAEEAGFDIFQVGDHVGAEPSALAASAAVAGTTEQIRLGSLVLNNDLRHPVVLAQELATLDHLSRGRLEVGMGAGHSFTEYAAMGRAFDTPAVRKERLAESVEIIRALLDGGPVSFSGNHYHLDAAVTLSPLQEHVPLLVGVNGRAALAHAAHHADVVAPTMLGRTLEDGHSHDVRWEASRLDDTMRWIRAQAGDRWSILEVHALVQAVIVTDDRRHAALDIGGAYRDGRRGHPVHAVPVPRHPRADSAALLACRGALGLRLLQRPRRRCLRPRHAGAAAGRRCVSTGPLRRTSRAARQARAPVTGLPGSARAAGARHRPRSRRRRRTCRGWSGPG